MSVISNASTTQTVTLKAFQRTSFSFYVKFFDERRRAWDITDADFRLVIQNAAYPYNNVVVNYPATQEDSKGFIRFDLQTYELDLDPGEYPYSIVMVSPKGYSSVVVKGVFQIIPNPDAYAILDEYVEGEPVEGVEVFFRGQNIVTVRVAPMLPPNMNFLSDRERDMLYDLFDRVQRLEQM